MLRQGGELWPGLNLVRSEKKNFMKFNVRLIDLKLTWSPENKKDEKPSMKDVKTTSIPTCSVGSLEAFLLNRIVREKANEQLVSTGCDGLGLLGATEATQTRRFSITPIINLNVVISTLQVGLHIDLIEGLWQNKIRTE